MRLVNEDARAKGRGVRQKLNKLVLFQHAQKVKFSMIILGSLEHFSVVYIIYLATKFTTILVSCV